MEYMTHWAGWPDENDTWSLGPGNIPHQFIRDYNLICDPYRNDPIEQIPVESLLSIANNEPRGKQKRHGNDLKDTDTTPKKKVRRTSVKFKGWNSLASLEREGNKSKFGGNDKNQEDVEMAEADEV